MLPLLLLLCVLIMPAISHAERKILTAEATYMMGDGESPSFAEAMALQKAKQMALEQAGTYVESYTKIKNYDLSHEEIQTIAGGVLEVGVLEKTRALVGDSLQFYVKIKATVTTDKMAELAQRIKGKNYAEEYKKLREDYAKLSQEIEKWKQLVAKTPQGLEREAALNRIREREQAFALIQKREAAWQMEVHECDSRPVSDACMTLLFNAGFSPTEVMTWANDNNQAAKAAAHKLLKSYGCEAKSVTASCLHNLKDAGFTDYQVGEWLNKVDVEYPGQRKTAEWMRLKEVYREGPEGPLREYERKYSGASRREN